MIHLATTWMEARRAFTDSRRMTEPLAPCTDTTPTQASPDTPRTVEQIVAFAEDYAAGKQMKRTDVASFMRDLLALLHAPIVTATPVPEPAAVPCAPVDPLSSGQARCTCANELAELAALHLGVEPKVMDARTIYLPPEANRRYTAREARVLGAQLVTAADRIDAAFGRSSESGSL